MAYRLGLRLGGLGVLVGAASWLGAACGGGGGGGGFFPDGGFDGAAFGGTSGNGGSGFGGSSGNGGGPFGGSSGVGGGSGGAGGGCTPSQEVCDGADNDCNGQVDEADPQLNVQCSTGLPGGCATGTYQCQSGTLTCVPPASVSETCNGQDDDCDGAIDDNVPGTGGNCTANGLGVCAQGTLECTTVGGNHQIACVATTTPSTELCDGLDNDCDGQTDENNPGGGTSCSTGLPGVCAQGTNTCQGGSLQCIPNTAASTETCDGLDNDCDGQTDENNPGGGGSCGCGGTLQCQSGSLQCVGGGTTTYFEDDFSTNKGWTLGTYWAIGSAQTSTGHSTSCGPDPSLDHTTTSDNGVAGVVLGGNYPVAVGGPYYVTSPVINTAAATNVVLEYWRWLNSDYPSYVTNTVQVFNGTSWVTVWTSPTSTVINDTSWQKQTHNITAYKNAQMRIRFGYQVGSTSAYTCGGWNVDDVVISSGACP